MATEEKIIKFIQSVKRILAEFKGIFHWTVSILTIVISLYAVYQTIELKHEVSFLKSQIQFVLVRIENIGVNLVEAVNILNKDEINTDDKDTL